MNQQTYKKSFVIGAVAIGVIAGVAVGFFTAHRMMGDMDGMTMGTGGVSAPPGRAGEMGRHETDGDEGWAPCRACPAWPERRRGPSWFRLWRDS